MKDINGIRPISVNQQASIARWYRVTKSFTILYILILSIFHCIQVYTWYLSRYTLCGPVCTSTNTYITQQYATHNEHLALAQEYNNCIKRLNVYQNWHDRLQCIQKTIPYIYSIDITQKNMTCVIHCHSINTCMEIIKTLSAQADIESALCTSIKPDTKNTEIFICTIQCQYRKRVHPIQNVLP